MSVYGCFVAALLTGPGYTPQPDNTIAQDQPGMTCWHDMTTAAAANPGAGAGWTATFNSDGSVATLTAPVLPVVPTAPTFVTTTALQAATSGLATQIALSAVQATIPTPATTVPQGAMPVGTAGTAKTYTPSDAVQPSKTRNPPGVTTDANGNFTATWSNALPSAAYSTNATLEAPAGTPSGCTVNKASQTTTQVQGYCWSSASVKLSILTTGSVLGVTYGPAANASVDVLIRMQDAAQ